MHVFAVTGGKVLETDGMSGQSEITRAFEPASAGSRVI